MDHASFTVSPSVCIIIPVCNEEESIALLRNRLRTLHQRLQARFRVEYLFVDDGSTDGTSQLLSTAVPAGAGYQIHVHAQNYGVGAAFRTGFHHAEADIVCTIDADCSYGPEHLLAMIQEIAVKRADVVVASPYHPNGGVDGVQRWRLLLSAQCSRLYRLVSPLKLYTYTSIFRAYRGSFVRKARFRSAGFVATVEILLSASSLGLHIAEMPLTLRRRSAGVSKMRIARTIHSHAKLMTDCLLARNHGYPSFCRTESTTHLLALPNTTHSTRSAALSEIVTTNLRQVLKTRTPPRGKFVPATIPAARATPPTPLSTN